MTYRKKLIEVALPLEAINKASAREKSIRHGHPSTLHLWWARRPLAAARAVIFSQMVDDPSSHPEKFPTEEAQEKERQRLFRLIEQLVLWENTTNEAVLAQAREEIWKSWRLTCEENKNHPRAAELFNPEKLPAFHDPFAGGGSLPLEAQRLGLEAYASDLNPVAVLINKAMIEIPPKFAGRPPVNPESRADRNMFAREWRGAQGLAEDVRYYGQWMRDEAEKRIGHLYPKIEITVEMAKERQDLKPLVGKKLTVIAWLWARTVKSPNPAFAHVDVPLASTFMLSTKAGKEAYIEPVIEGDGYRFTVKLRKPKDVDAAKNGTKLSRGANFKCLMSGTPIAGDYIKAEGTAGRMGVRLMAIVAEGERNRVYLAPITEQERAAREAMPQWRPEGSFVEDARAFTPFLYGLKEWHQLFTDRQMVAMTSFSDLVSEAMERIRRDALAAGLLDDPILPRDRDTSATAYAEAVAVYLGLTSSKAARFTTTLATWRTDETKLSRAFTRNDLPMTWDFAETNPFSGTGGDFAGLAEGTAAVLQSLPAMPHGAAIQRNACEIALQELRRVISTDPPYYDNVPYADLSDYFYVWLRHSQRAVLPELFATMEVPKAQELVATSYRHGGKENAETFFLEGMAEAMHRLAEQAHFAFPVSIYYAFKQSESGEDASTTSTGWETFLAAVVRAGFGISGTWPARTEGKTRMRGMNSNALASSIVLVCRPRPANAPTATRREFLTALKAELPDALAHLQSSNIAPVDLAQAAIGPGMAVYTRYAKVLDAEGKPLSVREALALINQTLDDALAEQEGDFDADSRFALAWFEQSGFDEGEFGMADVLARAKNTSVAGMSEAGILKSSRGKVRLLKPNELPADWDPANDARLTAWEMVHQLIRSLEAGGEGAAAVLAAKLGSKAEVAREFAYRLYTVCERKKRAAEALSYNALVQSWPEIMRLARESGRPQAEQATIFGSN
ncbi:hypothetical protein DCC62_15350 [candidate division KSB1 bacterium]|nr:MAG: hypothetical protein DCC62_15350 [candidate division KSB1 bacterium]